MMIHPAFSPTGIRAIVMTPLVLQRWNTKECPLGTCVHEYQQLSWPPSQVDTLNHTLNRLHMLIRDSDSKQRVSCVCACLGKTCKLDLGGKRVYRRVCEFEQTQSMMSWFLPPNFGSD